MTPYKSIQPTPIPGWVLLPMRLFLGVTFVYAGIQKFMDPQFFNPKATGYIGRQIIGFAASSPLHSFLLIAAQHARLFGLMTAYGEIAIGLGILFGFLFRPAAFFGMLISLLFFLSATWRVYPYFYGSDIVFTVCWLTMVINGPLNTGLPTLDEWLTITTLSQVSPQQQQQLTPAFAILLGTTSLAPEVAPALATPATTGTTKQTARQQQQQQQQRRYSTIQRAKDNRRNFLSGVFTGGATILGLFTLGYAINRFFSSTDDSSTVTTPGSSSASTAGSASSTTTTTSTTPGTTSAIAQVSAVPTNSATTFTIPSSGDPGVLVHLNNGQFVAYDALCTHAGCQVSYDPSSQLLLCPCHGAAFDPSKNAAVVNPPAPTPLTAVSIHVDSATGAITLA